nr:immunoglobulin heavy chain junction region [Macaca mulatta]MOX39347.1 immunoglobulin heavy chain junction region [Macaca mulatta]MOX39443.1 immunoglobulin heavy chain junction region [Macaca mulatta]MOX39545.1 immunoglobulin heavy chain junction region [Macaca mulatta]MOX39838.1 immunoglobulin heavy chain junction region [Macaca mulatta]
CARLYCSGIYCPLSAALNSFDYW